MFLIVSRGYGAACGRQVKADTQGSQALGVAVAAAMLAADCSESGSSWLVSIGSSLVLPGVAAALASSVGPVSVRTWPTRPAASEHGTKQQGGLPWGAAFPLPFCNQQVKPLVWLYLVAKALQGIYQAIKVFCGISCSKLQLFHSTLTALLYCKLSRYVLFF